MGNEPNGNDTPDYTTALAVGDLSNLLASMPPPPEYRPVDVLNAIVSGNPLPEIEDETAATGMLIRILSAPTLEEAISGNDTEDLAALLKRNLTINRVRWFPSEYKDGSACFAVLDVVTEDDGQVHTMVTGSLQVMTVAWRAWSEKKLPFRCQIVKSERATRAGFFPYNVVSPVAL